MLWWTLRQLQSKNPATRARAARTLGDSRKTRTVQPLVAAFRDKDRHVRQAAAQALGQLGDAGAVEPLVAALRDEAIRQAVRGADCSCHSSRVAALRDETIRQAVRQALIQIGGTRAVEPLVAILRDEASTVREAAAQMLGQLGDARAVEPLVALLRDEYSFVREAAAHALAQLGDARAVEPLVAALQERDRGWPIRQGAAQALVQIGPAAVEPLVALLRDQGSAMRQTAAQALGQLGDARAVEPLVALLTDEDSHVREAAAQALTSLDWRPGNDTQRALLAIAQGKGLTLRELVNPVFPYVAPNDRVNEVSVDSPLHTAITARGAFLGKQCQLTEYLRILQDAATTCPHEDLPYVWLAELHLMQGRYTEAKQWAFDGLNKAREFERLTYVLASVYLRMSDSAAIGWFMQSCLLATFEFIPYLFCARCAEVAELNGLYRRLLNASDAISPGRRVPDDEAQVVSLALKVDRTELANAMSTFQANMESFLPAADAFPEHPDERDIFIWAHDDIRRDIRLKLFARPQGGK